MKNASNGINRLTSDQASLLYEELAKCFWPKGMKESFSRVSSLMINVAYVVCMLNVKSIYNNIIFNFKMFGYSMDVLFPEAVTMIIMTEYKVDRDQVFTVHIQLYVRNMMVQGH